MVKEKIVGMVVMIILFSLMNVEGQLPVDEDVVMSCDDNEGVISIRYNPVFEIGEEWPVYLEWSCENDVNFVVEITDIENRTISITNGSGEDGIVFPGYTFYEEHFNILVKFWVMNGDEEIEVREMYIDVNKTAPDDLRNLWIAMSIFWIAIGGYMKYMYEKKENIEKYIKSLKEENEEDEKKN